MVNAMAACGMTQVQIARVIGIHDETLRIHYRRELDLGMVEANAKVAEALFKLAVGGDVTAAIWWCKCRMGWRERTGIEHSGTITVATALDAAVRKAADGTQGKGSERHCSQRV